MPLPGHKILLLAQCHCSKLDRNAQLIYIVPVQVCLYCKTVPQQHLLERMKNTAAFRGTEVRGINKSIPHKGHRSDIVIVGSTVNSVSGFVVFDCLLVNAAERRVSGGF